MTGLMAIEMSASYVHQRKLLKKILRRLEHLFDEPTTAHQLTAYYTRLLGQIGILGRMECIVWMCQVRHYTPIHLFSK